LWRYLSGTVIRGTPTLLHTVGNHHQHKLQRLMGTIQINASSTQGARSRLARAQPRAGTVVPDEVTSRPRASSGSGRTFGTPEAQLEQASSRSNLSQIASPTDHIAGTFNHNNIVQHFRRPPLFSAAGGGPPKIPPYFRRSDRAAENRPIFGGH
jgi:hypothetical protein